MAPHVASPEILHDLVVPHTQGHPVFVLGCGRSGTSMFGALLRKYTKVNFGPETQFIVEYRKRLHRYGDLAVDANAELLLSDLAKERCFERWHKRFGFRLDTARVLREARERIYPALLTAIFEQFARHNGMTRWGDKSPNYDRDLPVILELFPTARFIHIVRDGRDVAVSVFKVFFGAKNAYKAALDWRRQVGWVRAFAARLPPEQFLEVRYEDVLVSPREVFRQILPFLGISDPDNALLHLIAYRIKDDLRPDTAGRWLRELSPRQVEVFEAVAGDTLVSFGYPLAGNGRRRQVGPVARAVYLLDNRLRRWMNLGFQHDNVYALGKRLRRYTQPLRKALTVAPPRHAARRLDTGR